MTLTTLESAHELMATPQIESTLMTVKKPALLRAHVARGDEEGEARALEAVEDPRKSEASRSTKRRRREDGRDARGASIGVQAEPRTGGRRDPIHRREERSVETASVVRSMTRMLRVANSGVYGGRSDDP